MKKEERKGGVKGKAERGAAPAKEKLLPQVKDPEQHDQ